MKFIPTTLNGSWIIEPDKLVDSRGFFARLFSADEFEKRKLEWEFVQSSISFNAKKGTLRGMHYQEAPYEEVRLVRCTRGKIFDCLIDLRSESKTFKQHFIIELTEDNGYTVYIPKGFAHGFMTLEDNSEVAYWMSAYYRPEASKGVRFDDPAFGIRWPLTPAVISEKDANFSKFI